ncbi:hypothetical protein H8K35_12790 [Undibacterium sp. LX40W]|uniref:Uncharacterized protein n=1 Tax=Undibacterium nitidum TaxID=2762298 RepID=A0A923HMC4_9BURK|nr:MULTISPECIES: hypothetical protein [Undibacterium]MBC3882265.1 hypothetical protein [Undibacterium nitidum]MBC3892546.1 hypothetical protein [Undibacterium sp. LX40W]
MKKIAFLLVLMLVGFATHLYYVFRPIEGIDVSETAVSLQSTTEKYEYHRHLRLLLSDQDPEDLRYLINVRCDGEGAYEHGKTLVQALIKLGDTAFSGMTSKLNKTETQTLLTFMTAGHEYGNFSAFPELEEFKRRFPLTFKSLSGKV